LVKRRLLRLRPVQVSNWMIGRNAVEVVFASGIFRALEELEARDCIWLVHGFEADDTFCCIAFALGNQRRCRRIECAAMRAEERAAF
jgi:hypothetical protein